MIAFIKNPWVIGISGGIISGIIVYFITNFIVSRKEKRLYNQKIGPANFEIMQTIRPLIINKERFNKDIYDSILSSLANKHEVSTTDLYSLEELCNDVITDIVQTPFLTSDQKDEYSSTLLSIKIDDKPDDVKEKIIYINKGQRSSISSKYLSMVMALTTSIFGMTAILITLMDRSDLKPLFDSDVFKISSTGVITLIMIPVLAVVSIMMTDTMKKTLKRYRDLKKLRTALDEDYKNETAVNSE